MADSQRITAGIGHKQKHVLYDARPSPAALLHFVCAEQTQAARAWPMRLFGDWAGPAVAAELEQAELMSS